MPRGTHQAQGNKPRQARAPWYGDGLRFECLRCNACCGGDPGYVWVDKQEIAHMAAELGIPVARFTAQYCRRILWRVSLREMPNGDCVMLRPQGCRVYRERPRQCRTWPFWPDNVDTREEWQEVRRRCPGAGRGRLYLAEEIHKIGRGQEGTL